VSAARQVLVAEGFTPPGPADFELPAVFGDSLLFTKPALLLVLAAVMVFGFFLVTSRKMAMVPSKAQYAGEQAYSFVRNGIARDIIGSHDFMKFVPLLVALFFFILLNNVFGIIPFIQFPTFSRVSFAYALAGLIWVVYNGIGIWKHGLFGYLKHVTVQAVSGAPSCCLSSLWSSSPRSSFARPRWRCGCSPTCSLVTSC